MKFIKGDCVKILPRIKDIDLIITDPPYNIGWDYGTKINDRKKNYHEWCIMWAELCFNSLQKEGVIAIINYPENNNILYSELIKRGYNFIQQLIWSYPTNIGQSKKRYTRSYRTILIFSKSKDYIFNPETQDYKNPNDKRIKERIEKGFLPTHYDVFNINLCKNVSKTKKNNGINQLPEDLVKMLINTYSEEKMVVLDPFVGNGTVMQVAKSLNRFGIGIDINNYSRG